MIDKELLDVLICPESKTPLKLADDALVARLNEAIEAGRLTNRIGEPICEPIDGGLVREDGTLLYPIVDGVPSLLVDGAILVEEISKDG
ncbi:MAG: Trm112 family protein [Planctomycetota bacterium]